MPLWVSVILLGLVEGITEFLPVSSTGHLIVAEHLLGWQGEQAATFAIFIQLGAILAVVLLYKERFIRLIPCGRSQGFAGVRGLCLLALTTLPALVLGFVTHQYIKHNLFNPATVAVGLGAGGVAILLIESFLPRRGRTGLDALEWHHVILVGLFQCLALWPGVSRSAATIIGGMIAGLDRKTATEYSFFAAVPVLFAAVAYDLLKSRGALSSFDIPFFALGFVVAFLSAWVTVKWFIHVLSSHTLRPFGWYRLAATAALILLLSIGGCTS